MDKNCLIVPFLNQTFICCGELNFRPMEPNCQQSAELSSPGFENKIVPHLMIRSHDSSRIDYPYPSLPSSP
eukprot:scaffold6052_cov118-Cylindrotheca_fusiformis.AAC.22